MSDLDWVKDFTEKEGERFIELSKEIWSYAELPFEEKKSAQKMIRLLKEEGFEVTENISNISTAFTASFGKGRPRFGFLGEFDALDGLNQKGACAKKLSDKPGAPGHGCGHNLLGAGALGAAIGMKRYLEEKKIPGTLIFFGCPAEEGFGSKNFMARDGLFDDMDFIYSWHPSDKNAVQQEGSSAIIGARFEFSGISAHAGSEPWKGRSALDACELMNIGANYLREHIQDQERIHYAYENAGGSLPNVIPDRAAIKYEVRSPKIEGAQKIYQRIRRIAEGAALMTETHMSFQMTFAFCDYETNRALAPIAQKALEDLGPTPWTEEDQAFAEGFRQEKKGELLTSRVEPFDPDLRIYESGSTDVGDVSYAAPVVNFLMATQVKGTPGHSWQVVSQSNSPIGNRGLLQAIQVLILSAMRTIQDPSRMKEAKEEVQRKNGGKFTSPMPEEVQPPRMESIETK